MDEWKRVWREAVVPLLNRAHLEALRDALRDDDPRLIQGQTTSPPPLQAVADWPVEGACALGFCAWRGDRLETVSEVEEAFARWSFAIDQRLHEPGGCRWFFNFFDETPREQMRRELLPEVESALASLPS